MVVAYKEYCQTGPTRTVSVITTVQNRWVSATQTVVKLDILQRFFYGDNL